MRILMLNNEFPPKGGGMGTVNRELFRRFCTHPVPEIDLITSSIEDGYRETAFCESIRIFEVPVGRGNIHHAGNLELVRFGLQSYFLAHQLFEQQPYDLVFAWSTIPSGAVAMALSRRYGRPFMTRVTGPDIPGFERRYRWLFPILTPLVRQVWKKSTPLIAKCGEEIELIRRVDNGIKPIIIPNGVDTSKYTFGYGQRNNTVPVIICVARLIERKGQRHLIEAARRLKAEGLEVSIHLVGEGDSRAAYERYAEELGVADRIRFLGFIESERIPDFLGRADIFCLPSFNEGMSLATLEAMASGLPIIVTKTGGTRDLVVEGHNGYSYDWGDVAALTRLLKELVTDRESAAEMGAASRRLAEHFSWDEVVAQYLALLTAVN